MTMACFYVTPDREIFENLQFMHKNASNLKFEEERFGGV